MHCVGAKAGFIPKQNFRTVASGLAGQRRIGPLLPQGNNVRNSNNIRISMIGSMSGLLQRQLSLSQSEPTEVTPPGATPNFCSINCAVIALVHKRQSNPLSLPTSICVQL